MKIEIEINDPKMLVLLSRWASAHRTLKTALSACEQASTDACLTDYDRQTYDVCHEELEQLINPLCELHVKAQQAMWQKMCGQSVRKMHGYTNDIVCRLEKGHEGTCRGL